MHGQIKVKIISMETFLEATFFINCVIGTILIFVILLRISNILYYIIVYQCNQTQFHNISFNKYVLVFK